MTESVFHRRFTLLSGELEWSLPLLGDVLLTVPSEQLLWIGSAPNGVVVTECKKSQQVLGREYRYLVFNAFDGFNPDCFAAAVGTLSGNGRLVLLCPSLQEWPLYLDPDKQRYCQYPHSLDEVDNRFIQRLVEQLSLHPEAQIITPQNVISPDALMLPEINTPDFSMTNDQRIALEAVAHVVHGHANRPLVLIADRGRGKSSVLAWAAADVMMNSSKKIVITAPTQAALTTFFAQLLSKLPELQRNAENAYVFGDAVLTFALPHACLQLAKSPDLLLVDEAAAIPANMLTKLLSQNNRAVFSTTVHGYEGSGRGFDIRFRETLNATKPQWKELRLNQPVRWAENDPLELWLFDALLLHAGNIEKKAITEEEVVYSVITQDDLVSDECLLIAVFGLLTNAHYQTRPSDLRQLLDSPDLHIVVAKQEARVLGVVLAISEGNFDASLAEKVWAGNRRPRGHLLAQSLATHAGFKDAATLSVLRVMRIAVDSQWRQQGIGSEMLNMLERHAIKHSFAMLGTSFAATQDVLAFWQQNNYLAARIGHKTDPASGEHSLQMIKCVDTQYSSLVTTVAERFQENLPWELATYLQAVDAKLVVALLAGRNCQDAVLNRQDKIDLRAITEHHRDLMTSIAVLWRLSIRVVAQTTANIDVKTLLIKRFIQQQSSRKIVEDCETLTGKKQLMQQSRQAIIEGVKALEDLSD